MEIEGYEYNIQYRWRNETEWNKDTTSWHYIYTNRFSEDAWYPALKSVNNALAQMKATRYGYNRSHDREFRIVKRPYGAVEVV